MQLMQTLAISVVFVLIVRLESVIARAALNNRRSTVRGKRRPCLLASVRTWERFVFAIKAFHEVHVQPRGERPSLSILSFASQALSLASGGLPNAKEVL